MNDELIDCEANDDEMLTFENTAKLAVVANDDEIEALANDELIEKIEADAHDADVAKAVEP